VYSQIDLKTHNVIKSEGKWRTNIISWDKERHDFRLYPGIADIKNINYFNPTILKEILKIPF
jgi:hypothetical protein